MKTTDTNSTKAAMAGNTGYLPLNTIHLSDNIDFLKTLPDNSVDAIITDSPYGLGKEPNAVKCLQDWIDRGYHEVSGKGFMGKTWDAFVPQPVLWTECYRVLKPGGHLLSFFGTRTYDWGTLAIRLAGFEIRDCIQWIYGSGFPKSKCHLKPANEPICVARKPGVNIPLNIEDCRIDLNGDHKGGLANRTKGIGELQNDNVYGKAKRSVHDDSVGRYPSNVILDEDTSRIMDLQSGILKSGAKKAGGTRKNNLKFGKFELNGTSDFEASEGGASRFFYVAKASPSERKGNAHPTVKPLSLMVQLVKLYSHEGAIVVDPHMGSGTTCLAAKISGRKYIGIDFDDFSFNIANKRLFEATDLFD